jgi:hypothetical protein
VPRLLALTRRRLRLAEEIAPESININLGWVCQAPASEIATHHTTRRSPRPGSPTGNQINERPTDKTEGTES